MTGKFEIDRDPQILERVQRLIKKRPQIELVSGQNVRNKAEIRDIQNAVQSRVPNPLYIGLAGSCLVGKQLRSLESLGTHFGINENTSEGLPRLQADLPQLIGDANGQEEIDIEPYLPGRGKVLARELLYDIDVVVVDPDLDEWTSDFEQCKGKRSGRDLDLFIAGPEDLLAGRFPSDVFKHSSRITNF